MGLSSLYFCKFQHKYSLIYLLSESPCLILLKEYCTVIYSRYISFEVLLFKDFTLENIQTKGQ